MVDRDKLLPWCASLDFVHLFIERRWRETNTCLVWNSKVSLANVLGVAIHIMYIFIFILILRSHSLPVFHSTWAANRRDENTEPCRWQRSWLEAS
jgi:hypothetical protein